MDKYNRIMPSPAQNTLEQILQCKISSGLLSGVSFRYIVFHMSNHELFVNNLSFYLSIFSFILQRGINLTKTRRATSGKERTVLSYLKMFHNSFRNKHPTLSLTYHFNLYFLVFAQSNSSRDIFWKVIPITSNFPTCSEKAFLKFSQNSHENICYEVFF